MNLDLPGGREHPSWSTAVATLVAYGVVLAVMFLALFVVPYLAYSSLA